MYAVSVGMTVEQKFSCCFKSKVSQVVLQSSKLHCYYAKETRYSIKEVIGLAVAAKPIVYPALQGNLFLIHLNSSIFIKNDVGLKKKKRGNLKFNFLRLPLTYMFMY